MDNSKRMTQSSEDYLETIYNNTSQGQGVSITLLSQKMKVAKASAHNAVDKLKEMGLVVQEAYGLVHLTDRGEAEGKKVSSKHKLLYKFLSSVLNVSHDTAEKDACAMEHALSAETVQALTAFVNEYTSKNKD